MFLMLEYKCAHFLYESRLVHYSLRVPTQTLTPIYFVNQANVGQITQITQITQPEEGSDDRIWLGCHWGQ